MRLRGQRREVTEERAFPGKKEATPSLRCSGTSRWPGTFLRSVCISDPTASQKTAPLVFSSYAAITDGLILLPFQHLCRHAHMSIPTTSILFQEKQPKYYFMMQTHCLCVHTACVWNMTNLNKEQDFEASDRKRGRMQTHQHTENPYQGLTISLFQQESKDKKRIKNSVWLRDSVSFSICLMDRSGNSLKDVTAAEHVTRERAVASFRHCSKSRNLLLLDISLASSTLGPSQLLSPIKRTAQTLHPPSVTRKRLKEKMQYQKSL